MRWRGEENGYAFSKSFDAVESKKTLTMNEDEPTPSAEARNFFREKLL